MKSLCLVCLLALGPLSACANIVPSSSTIAGSGPYVWTYELQLARDQNAQSGLPPTASPVAHNNLRVGSFLTLYDFAGYIADSCTGPAGWVCTAQFVGFTPDEVLPDDDASLLNLTWVYTIGPTLGGHPGGLALGLFGASSIYGTSTPISYAARGVRNGGGLIGTFADNVGRTEGPSAVALPEPGSLALAGLALVLIGGMLPKRWVAR